MNASTRTPFTADDLLLYRAITAIEGSPDGGEVVYAVQEIDREGDASRTSLWVVSLDDGAPWQLTQGAPTESQPRYTLDGSTIMFVSSRSGSPQVHAIRRSGGEARQVTRLPQGLSSYALSRDGTKLVVVAAFSVDSDARGAQVQPPKSPRPHVAWKVPYKSNGAGYSLATQAHLFVVDVASGDARQLTRGDFDVSSAAFSPDGTRIVFVRTREGRQAHRGDVWTVNADGTDAKQASSAVASVLSPRWSPDGRTIVFQGGEIEGEANVRLWKLDVASGDVRAFGPDWLETLPNVAVRWSDDSRRLTFVNARFGRQEVASIDVETEEVTSVVRDEHLQVRNVATCGDRVAYVSSRLTEPCDLYVADATGGGHRRLTDLNAWWRERRQPVVSLRTFTVPDGDGGQQTIEGWLVVPEGAEPGPLPLLVDAHGGPHSYVDLDYSRYVHWPVLWSRGWSILATNGIGSSSYGPEFARRINGRWGELCLPQDVAVLDTLVQEGRADARVAVTGKSYGGFLAAWAIGHTDRFACAVVAAPVTNLQSHFGTSDSGYYVTSYAIGGEIWEARDVAQRLSPINYAHLVTTPTLILQGEDDGRCPVGQSEELFATMMRAGNTPVELVVYPGEHHGIAEAGTPSTRVDYFTRLVEWVVRWCEADESLRATPRTTDTRDDARSDQRRVTAPEPVAR